MRILKTKKRIDFDICLRNIYISTFHYCDCSTGELEHWAEIICWYESDCENCPLGWESRSYEGECEDCGCFFDHDFNVPKWKCMLPNFVKKIYLRRKERE